MTKSIAAIVGAALAVLLLAASVAAADPFGWRASGQGTYGNGAGYGNGYGCCTDWHQAPTASQAAPTASSSPSSAPTHHQVNSPWSGTQNPMAQRQTTSSGHARGSDWCDHWGRSDYGWH